MLFAFFALAINTLQNKGRIGLPKRMNFRKSSEGGGGAFPIQNLCCKIWTFKKGFFSMKIIENGLFRVCFSTNFHVELLYYMDLMGNMII